MLDVPKLQALALELFPGHGPVQKHDCDRCIFIKNGPVCGQDHDWWLCPPSKFNPTGSLIARWGKHGDYASFPVETILNWGKRPGMEFGGTDPEGFVQQGRKLLAELGVTP